jgi:hypothetical protein
MTLSGYGYMRASSADRERAVDVLKAAFAEGRLDQGELSDRLGRAHAARTYDDLAVLVADLPIGPFGTLPQAPLPMPPPMARPRMAPPPIAPPLLPPVLPAAGPRPPLSRLAIIGAGLAMLDVPAMVYGAFNHPHPLAFLPGNAAMIFGAAAVKRIRCGQERGMLLAVVALTFPFVAFALPLLIVLNEHVIVR